LVFSASQLAAIFGKNAREHPAARPNHQHRDNLIAAGTLDHAKHNRGDECDGDIGGHHAQPADERHRKSLFTSR
jgi:hypothetical protein